MAAGKYWSSFLSLTNPNRVRWREGVRLYVQFSPGRVEPIFRKDEIENILKIEKKENLLMTARLPPNNVQTCSVFYDPDKEKLINVLMRRGDKELARKALDRALTLIKHEQLRKYNKETDEEKRMKIIIDPVKIMHMAIKNISPSLNTLKIRKSGTWYKVPVGVSPKFAKFLSMKWIATSSKHNHGNILNPNILASELLKGSQYEGKSIQKKLELHKLCEANRSFAHYKWT